MRFTSFTRYRNVGVGFYALGIEMLIYLSMLGVGIYQLEIYFAGVGRALLLAWI